MTIQALGSIGEFVGSVLLLVSVIYLAIQVRQNSRTIANTAFLDVVREGNRLEETYLEDPERALIMKRGAEDLSSLSERERIVFDTIWGISLRNYTSVVVLENTGVLAKDEISAVYERMYRGYKSESMQNWWSENRDSIAFSELRDRIDSVFDTGT